VEEADGAVLVAGPRAAAGLHGDRGAATVNVGSGDIENHWLAWAGWKDLFASSHSCFSFVVINTH
jgi:hypothetical protein